MTEPILALTHEGAWYYYLPNAWSRCTWHAHAGDQSEELRVCRQRWYVGTFEAERIAKVAPQQPTVLRWELIDSAAVAERFPAVLTPDEWRARTSDDDDDSLPERSLYRAVTEPQPDQVTWHDGPWLRADGEPPPSDGRTWVAKLPYELSQHRELLHLFPGRLTGFRDALAARLKAIPGVEVWLHSSPSEIYAKVPYDPPRHRWQGALLRSGSRSKTRGAEVQEYLTRRRPFNPVREIDGTNRTDAAAKWDAEMERWVALVTEMVTVRPCGTCGGTGVGPTQDGAS